MDNTQNHAWVKIRGKVQDRPMEFNVSEFKELISNELYHGFRLHIASNI